MVKICKLRLHQQSLKTSTAINKRSLLICNKNNYNKKIKDIKIEIVKDYCITSSILPFIEI